MQPYRTVVDIKQDRHLFLTSKTILIKVGATLIFHEPTKPYKELAQSIYLFATLNN